MDDYEIFNWSSNNSLFLDYPLDVRYVPRIINYDEQLPITEGDNTLAYPITDNGSSSNFDLLIVDESPSNSTSVLKGSNCNHIETPEDNSFQSIVETKDNECSFNVPKKITNEVVVCVKNKKKKVSKKKEKKVFRHSWSEEEDYKLRMLVEKYNRRHWKLIAKELGTDRLETECRQHFVRVLERTSTKGRWNNDEVCKLKQAVVLFSDWDDISAFVQTRDKFQCKSKWLQLCAVANRNESIC